MLKTLLSTLFLWVGVSTFAFYGHTLTAPHHFQGAQLHVQDGIVPQIPH